eukprot:4995917-Prymnesium_polylepis.2
MRCVAEWLIGRLADWQIGRCAGGATCVASGGRSADSSTRRARRCQGGERVREWRRGLAGGGALD